MVLKPDFLIKFWWILNLSRVNFDSFIFLFLTEPGKISLAQSSVICWIKNAFNIPFSLCYQAAVHFLKLFWTLGQFLNYSYVPGNVCSTCWCISEGNEVSVFVVFRFLWMTRTDILYQFSSVSQSFCVRLFVTPWIAARQASLSITNSQSSLKLMSIVICFNRVTARCYVPCISLLIQSSK